jgi:hypothetical protein
MRYTNQDEVLSAKERRLVSELLVAHFPHTIFVFLKKGQLSDVARLLRKRSLKEASI